MNRRELILSSAAVGIAMTLPGRSISAATEPAAQPLRGREVLSLNQGWRFFDGDIPFPKVMGHGWTYANAKAGNAQGAAAPGYDDTDWRAGVELPHDFVIEQPLDKDANLSQGYRRRGVAWYRNLLKFEESDRGKAIEIQFEGISTLATVWFNGTQVAHSWSGYSSLYIDVTPFATYGNHYNSLVVRVDADAMQGWWYEGGGIYRNVYVVKRSPVHIVTDGLFAHPVKSETGWQIPVEVTLASIEETTHSARLIVDLKDSSGRIIDNAQGDFAIQPLQQTVARLVLKGMQSPRLWSVESPELYTVTARLEQDAVIVDETRTTCGFRTERFDPDHGFFLNDKPVKLKGVCLHQDHAGVGVAVPAALWDFRLGRLKALGCNAIRCAHNAPAREFLDACDRLGFLVMDENRVFNPAPEHMAELTWMVRRDRNHPSIILWSVFNEEPMQGTEAGYQMVRRMREAVRELDTSRPVTGAMNDGLFTPINVSQTLDVMGFNYQQDSYDAFHRANPKIPITSSEDTSSFSVRGAYASDETKHIKGGYDVEPAGWGETHRAAWKAIAEREFVAGTFVWTGFDYRGEPTPYDWPTNASLFGIMDSCGFEKVPFFIHQAQWVDDRPIVSIAIHWTWPGREGQAIKVMVCANTDEVELKLNGKSLGRQKADRYEMNFYDVPYKPGRLEALGYRAGKVVVRDQVETTGPAVALRLTPDRPRLQADGIDAMPVTIEAVDAKGRRVPDAGHLVTFSTDGLRNLGLGNGDPNSLEADKDKSRSLFHGLAQLIVQSGTGSQTQGVITATAPGLRSAKLSFGLEAAARPLLQVTCPSNQTVENWFRAPAGVSDPMAKPGAGDNNSWQWFRAGTLLPATDRSGQVLCAISFTPFKQVQQSGGVIDFLGLTGRARIYADGQLIATKTDAAPAPLRAQLPPAPGERRLAIVFDVGGGEPFGLNDTIQVVGSDTGSR